MGILGFAFKADTNDIRESPAIRICTDLIQEGAFLAIYDPKVEASQVSSCLNTEHSLSQEVTQSCSQDCGTWQCVSSPLEAAEHSDAIIVLTEWNEFAHLNWKVIASVMRRPAWVFDARSVVNIADCKHSGLNVWTIGKGICD